LRPSDLAIGVHAPISLALTGASSGGHREAQPPTQVELLGMLSAG
jgi:hypothetical protein